MGEGLKRAAATSAYDKLWAIATKPWNHKSKRRLSVYLADGFLWIDEDAKHIPPGHQRGKWERQSVRLTIAELRELADKYAGKESARG